MDQKTANIKNNLMAQVESAMRGINEKGFETRYRYYDAVERFCGFLAEKFHSQKFCNIGEKHIKAYTEHMQAEGYSPSTIKTDLSGIRFFHDHMHGKHELPTNDHLHLERREIGGVDRAWTDREIHDAKMVADSMGRGDVALAIDLGRDYGLRLNEACTAKVNDCKEALYNGELHTIGKGGQERVIPVETDHQRATLTQAIRYAETNGRSGMDKVLCEPIKGGVRAEKTSIQNWIANHRDEFMSRPGESDRFGRVADRVSYHGCRHAYAQERYDHFINQGCSPEEARHKVSEELGHHRDAITKIYAGK